MGGGRISLVGAVEGAAAGLTPIQIWVPDMRSPSFVAEAHRQRLAVARSPHAKKDQDFIDAVSD